MKKIGFLSLCIILCAALPPLDETDINFTFVTLLPNIIVESSGLEIEDNNEFWSHNDSFNANELYSFNLEGTWLQQLTITNVENTDWEDLAQDEDGNFYIADIGNNFNQRTSLAIHKIPNPKDIPNSDFAAELEVEAESLEFVYEDQTEFPPPESQWFFDAESLIAFTDSFYIFTKSKSNPYIGKTKLYRLANEMGTSQTAELLGEFYTFDNLNDGGITSVDISPDHKKVILLSNTYLWIFYNFEGRNFLNGEVFTLEIPNGYKKREAVCFINNCEAYVTNEETVEAYPSIYKFNICNCLPTQVDLKVFLEGPYNPNTNLMNSDLESLSILPNNQPYNTEPYNYNGTESISTFSEEMVDWVLVEVRSGTPSLTGMNTIVVETKAGILLNNGHIVDPQNQKPLSFENLAYDEDYYFVIRHRNHLNVISNVPFTKNSTYFSYDFTTASSQAFGTNQLKEVATNQFAMFAGDFTQDGIIQISDYDVWKAAPAILNEYKTTDANLDGIVQVTDYDFWLPNKAKIGVGEVGF